MSRRTRCRPGLLLSLTLASPASIAASQPDQPPPRPPHIIPIPPPPAPPPPFEDSTLNEHFAAWKAEWDRLSAASGRQTEAARQAVRAAREAPVGSPLWLAARDAVLEAVQARRRQQAALWALMRHRSAIFLSLSDADQSRFTREIQDRELSLSRSEYFLRDVVVGFLRLASPPSPPSTG